MPIILFGYRARGGSGCRWCMAGGGGGSVGGGVLSSSNNSNRYVQCAKVFAGTVAIPNVR